MPTYNNTLGCVSSSMQSSNSSKHCKWPWWNLNTWRVGGHNTKRWEGQRWHNLWANRMKYACTITVNVVWGRGLTTTALPSRRHKLHYHVLQCKSSLDEVLLGVTTCGHSCDQLWHIFQARILFLNIIEMLLFVKTRFCLVIAAFPLPHYNFQLKFLNRFHQALLLEKQPTKTIRSLTKSFISSCFKAAWRAKFKQCHVQRF